MLPATRLPHTAIIHTTPLLLPLLLRPLSASLLTPPPTCVPALLPLLGLPTITYRQDSSPWQYTWLLRRSSQGASWLCSLCWGWAGV